MLRKTLLVGALAFAVPQCQAYSVLTHEAIIDAAWQSHLLPMLRARFPKATPDEIKEAHAYVYGGCLTQDMGYAPFSSKFWSDLAHYVRSGDLVEMMLRDAQTIDEYAFALGALAHYTADIAGHPSINRITARSYPKLRKKYGDVVTYEDSPTNHIKTEFSLDVVQVAREVYAPDAYHDFIGFEVAQSLLERAFQDTYGIEFHDLFKSEDLAIGTYRFSVGKVIPQMTKVAWQSKRKDIEQLSPTVTRSKFVFALPRKKYESEWGKEYRKPGIGSRILAFTFRLIPTFGPFRFLRFRPVDAESEKMFLRSFDQTIEQYRAKLNEVRNGTLDLKNLNLDTGGPIEEGSYHLADKTYDKLLERLAKRDFMTVSPDLRANVLAFYAKSSGAELSRDTEERLEQLKALAPKAEIREPETEKKYLPGRTEAANLAPPQDVAQVLPY